MSPNAEQRRRWSDWLGKQGSSLAAAGFPTLEFRDLRKWWRFLDEPRDDGTIGFSIDDISNEQCQIFLDLLQDRTDIAPARSSLIVELQRRLQKLDNSEPDE